MVKKQLHLRLQEQEPRLLALMLICLHAALNGEMDQIAERGFMLAHLGFFLLWQPFVQSDQAHRGFSLTSLLLTIIATGILFSYWLIALWLILLLGVFAGRTLSPGRGRAIYGFSLGILLWDLLVQVLPNIVGISPVPVEFEQAILVFSLTVLLGVVVSGRPKLVGRSVDYFQGISFTLLMLLMTMGSLLVYHHSPFDYLPSLLVSLASVIGLVVTMAVFWQSKGSRINLSQIWVNYLLNVGTPLETWLENLIKYAENNKLKADEFALLATAEFTQHNWIQGVKLELKDHRELGNRIVKLGLLKGETIHLEGYNLRLTLYLPYSIGGSLSIHARLLGRVFIFLYLSKLGEETLAHQSHLKAIYETGSKLTHDIKNNLQSLQTLTAVVTQENEDHDAAMSLLKRQLPEISNRLQLTLDKLKTPGNVTNSTIEFSPWWESLAARFEGRHIEFIYDPGDYPKIYNEALDTIIENLLDNARRKRGKETDLIISVHSRISENTLVLEVEDSGEVIPATTVSRLFKGAVSSENGFGIGLYQSYRASLQVGYELNLEKNQPGCVRFTVVIPIVLDVRATA